MPGGNKAILLLHGLYGNPLEVQYIGRKLHRAGYSVEIPYIHGCGVADTRSSRQTTSWENWLEQVEAHFCRMRREHAQVSVAGLCIGADLALALALEHSAEVHALCLYSTTLYYDGWNVTRWRFLRALAYYTPLRYLLSYHERHPYGLKDARIRQWVATQMAQGVETPAGAARSPFTGVYQAERMMRHLRRNLRRITAPVLILHALEDDFASPRSADLVESGVSSTSVRKVILQNSYHIITLDNDKDRVAQETLDFIAGQTDKHSLVNERGLADARNLALAA
ncbi:MAG: alpha/beta hydrolase [Sulfuricella sp.]|jgi:carboxylesterase|nr:alpha/beta hydrolase [Sulfuricella sp.]